MSNLGGIIFLNFSAADAVDRVNVAILNYAENYGIRSVLLMLSC